MSATPLPRERRKVVTIVFADVVGSTALGERVDSETLRWAMQRWFLRMRDVVEGHGGTVENYIGDAVMAVFGIPVAHEDDALRAVRAAAAMRDEVVALRDELRGQRGVELAVRMGVNTGEAVTGTPRPAGSSRPVTSSTSPPGSSRPRPPATSSWGATDRLVRHAVQAEPITPLAVKGKAEALAAFGCCTWRPMPPGDPSASVHRWSDGAASAGSSWMRSIRR